jgi:hypothetical protein
MHIRRNRGTLRTSARHFEWPRRRAAEKGNELAAATHSITSSAWDEAGRHFGRAAEQVQTRAAAISEA